MFIPFSNWMPDSDPVTPNMLTDPSNNIVPTIRGYKGANSFYNVIGQTSLSATAVGMWYARRVDNTNLLFGGTPTNIYLRSGGAWTANTAVTVTATQISIGSTTGTYTPNTISLTLSTSTTGANALDTGTVAASTWYAVWAIYNETTVAGLLSLSATAPTMPSGYTHKGRIGWVRTDGSANLLRTIQYGTRAQYITPAAGFSSMATGTTSGAWLAVAVANFVPSTAGAIVVGAVKNNSNNTMAVHPNNAIAVPTGSASLSMLWSGNNSNQGLPTGLQGTIMLETTNVYWFSDGGTANMYAQGWIDKV